MAVLTRGGRRRRTELGFTSTSVVLAAHPGVPGGGRPGLRVRRAARAGCRGRSRRARTRTCCRCVALALGPAAVLARIVRVEMLDVLQADYIRTARAKRLPARADLPAPRAAERADRDAHPRRACCSARWWPAPCSSRTSSPGPAWAARSWTRSSTRTTRWCRRIVLVYGVGRAAGEPRRRRRPRAARPALDDPGELTRWAADAGARAPDAGRRDRAPSAGRRAARSAVLGPMLWGDRAERGRHEPDPAGAVAASTGPAPTASGRDIFCRVLVATRLSVVLALLATAVGVVTGLAARRGARLVGRSRVGRLVDAGVNIAVAVPGPAAGAVLRGHLRGRRDRARCWRSGSRSRPRSPG